MGFCFFLLWNFIFFRSPATMNMCSKCFRECQKPQQPQQASMTPSSSKPSTPTAPSAASVLSGPKVEIKEESDGKKEMETAAEAGSSDDVSKRKVQKNRGRCFSCRKKVGLTGFECKCGYVYCGEHRYSDKHDCDFDYKTKAREELAKANPVVMASKLEKI